ncbi:hypothetical protein [Paenibacillus sp. YPG26]|uniref:hypothetical protein n=1 Tax=Paenibacillus sp. YPG26 TaxID=2878915 RepID=UPI00203FA26F|nr:hypothetical protein [Paenibacillus sp. YPG26]USB34904.1 hypothetical protein LDO05_09200 [Paenibacillus sp. YPG26]
MKHWIFAGVSDKRELLLYLSKILTSNGQRVLLVDATEQSKYKYSIGVHDNEMRLTEFCGIDVASGYESALELFSDLDSHGESELSYDYILFDLEDPAFCGQDIWVEADAVVWVTSFERYALEKSREQFSELLGRYPQLQGMKIRRVYVQSVDSRLSEPYIRSFVSSLPFAWQEDFIEMPWDEANVAVHIESEHARTIGFNRVTRAYKNALKELLEQLTEWDKPHTRKLLRYAERRRA